MNRKNIKVKRLKLTPEQLEHARKKAEEEFDKLVVWKDSFEVCCVCRSYADAGTCAVCGRLFCVHHMWATICVNCMLIDRNKNE